MQIKHGLRGVVRNRDKIGMGAEVLSLGPEGRILKGFIVKRLLFDITIRQGFQSNRLVSLFKDYLSNNFGLIFFP